MAASESILRSVAILVSAANPVRLPRTPRGDARPDTDLDLLVVARDRPRRQADAARLRRLLSTLRIPLDHFVIDREQRPPYRSDSPVPFPYHALREGKVLSAIAGSSPRAPS